MKILFVAQNFQVGGIQKALINTLKFLSNNCDYEIDVFVFGNGNLISEIPNNINIIKGNLILELISTPFMKVKQDKNIINLFIRIISMICVRLVGSKKFYRYILKQNKIETEYDIAISYFNDVPSNYFNQGTNQMVDEFICAKRKIAWIHTDPIRSRFNKDECIEKYKNFDKIVCVSNACMDKFKEFLPIYSDRLNTVYNVFPIEEIKELSNKACKGKKLGSIKLVTVARMDNKTKRIDKILELISMLLRDGIDNFEWEFIGDGPDLESNKQYSNELGIEKYVSFLGNKSNPYPYIKQSNLFVLASEYEGYPMVVGEALILQVPVITTNYAAATEQIVDGVNGRISKDDLEGLYHIIKCLLLNPIEIEKMHMNCKNTIYNNDTAYNQIVNLMENKNGKGRKK